VLIYRKKEDGRLFVEGIVTAEGEWVRKLHDLKMALWVVYNRDPTGKVRGDLKRAQEMAMMLVRPNPSF